jgi:Luciferase-like monooxygenase
MEDSLGRQTAGGFAGPDDRTDQVRGRLDAVLTAARIAPHTTRIGLVPTAVTTHTEPFHLSTSIATLDYVSEGRAGWRPRVAASPDEARHSAAASSPRRTSPTPPSPRTCATCSTRRPTLSRSCGGCGTPGRTTR